MTAKKRFLWKKRFAQFRTTMRKFIENWKGHDYVLGNFTMLMAGSVVLLVWHVSVRHLWDLFRFHFLDMLLTVVAVCCFRYCYILYLKRGIPKFKTDWPVFWDRNGLILGLGVAGILALALIDPQLTTRLIETITGTEYSSRFNYKP